MDKLMDSPSAAVADISDGSVVAIAGFGVSHRFPSSLISALGDLGSKNLCVICNGLGQPGRPTAHLLAENKQISKLIACFSVRPGMKSEAELQIASGELQVELVPQGTLVERMRAGAAGLAALYTPTAVGTEIAEGKELRVFNGRPYILEEAIRPDFALVRAYRGDRLGNLQFRGASRNFNVSFAKAARTTIAEVEEVCEVGEIAPEDVDLPGVFVTRVVEATIRLDPRTQPTRPGRSADAGREYLGRPALTRSQVAERAALLFGPGSYVNLGAGMPTLISHYLSGRGVILHGENGILGYDFLPNGSEIDLDLHDAGGSFVTLQPGAAFFDSVTSFEIARSGRLDAVVLGAYQVSERGDLANWSTSTAIAGGIGGAMDLTAGARSVVVTMEHTDSSGNPKLVANCTYPLTAPERVDTVVTDLAVLHRVDGIFRLAEIAQGFTVPEVLSLTGMRVEVPEHVQTIQESLRRT